MDKRTIYQFYRLVVHPNRTGLLFLFAVVIAIAVLAGYPALKISEFKKEHIPICDAYLNNLAHQKYGELQLGVFDETDSIKAEFISKLKRSEIEFGKITRFKMTGFQEGDGYLAIKYKVYSQNNRYYGNFRFKVDSTPKSAALDEFAMTADLGVKNLSINYGKRSIIGCAQNIGCW